jgi:hypothetical protein
MGTDEANEESDGFLAPRREMCRGSKTIATYLMSNYRAARRLAHFGAGLGVASAGVRPMDQRTNSNHIC